MIESGSRAARRDPDSRASRFERINERFGIVLALLVATFVALACGFTSDWMLPVLVVLQGGTVLAVFAAARVSPHVQQIARVVVALCAVAAFLIVPGVGRPAKFAAAVLNGLLVAVCPIVIARSVLRRRVIDVRAVLGALCIYVLIGLFCAFVDVAIGTAAGHFFAQTVAARTSDYVYFSFVTLTTVGYGDLTASDGLGRAVAILEALIGQIYLVTVVALLVSNLGAGIRHRAD